MDWDDLRYLLAVHRAGSLVAAGRALGVDKATVSRRIAALEEALGVRLVDRKPDGYALTPHGERALQAVTEIDGMVGALKAELSDARGDATGVVHLTVPQFFATRLVIPALPAFRATHPRIEIVLNASSSVLNVAQREAEVALRNVKPEQNSVTVRRCGILGMALYASEAYLAQHGAPAERAALAHHDVVAWDRAICFSPDFAWMNDSGARVAVRGNDSAVLSDAIAAGLGIGELPCLLGDERAGLVRLDAFGLSRNEIYAVAPGELRRSGRVRAVIELLAGLFADNAARLAGEK